MGGFSLPSPQKAQSKSTRHFKHLNTVFKGSMFLISHIVSDTHTQSHSRVLPETPAWTRGAAPWPRPGSGVRLGSPRTQSLAGGGKVNPAQRTEGCPDSTRDRLLVPGCE